MTEDQATPATETTDTPEPSMADTRPELDEAAAAAGVENPTELPNKAAVLEAIADAPAEPQPAKRDRSTKPADVEAEILTDASAREQVRTGIAAVFGGKITFRGFNAQISKPVPTIEELAAALDAFLTERYGYEIGVALDRRDK